jgi:hypothetical protein
MSTEKVVRERRPNRKPIGTGDVLTAKKRPGFVRRWVNDVQDRVERFLDAGYELVKDRTQDTSAPGVGVPTHLGSSECRKPVGGGVHAVLMEIPEDWYEQDQAEKQKRVDEQVSRMKKPGPELYGSVEVSSSLARRD